MRGEKVPRAAEWKRNLVDEISAQLLQYPVVSLADISGVPARQFQLLRQRLRGEHQILVTKNTLLRLALEGVREKPELAELAKVVGGQCALILSKTSPFKLQKILKESMVDAPAKPGSKSDKDIIIPAGETDVPPGPAVGELQRLGIKARIQAGRVVITEDCRLVKRGDTITKEISDVLARFGILPLQLGLRLKAAVEGGLLFTPDILSIDEEVVHGWISEGWRNAFALAVNAVYFTGETVGVFLAKASASARALAISTALPVKELMPEILGLAHSRMLALAAAVGGKDPSALDQELMELIGQAAPQPAEAPKEEAEKPKEEEKEEDLSGLGALFG